MEQVVTRHTQGGGADKPECEAVEEETRIQEHELMFIYGLPDFQGNCA
jgi:hypothetical protein